MTVVYARRLQTLIFGLTLSALPIVGFAETNLLTNPGFDSDLAGWDNLYSGIANWSSRDAANSTSSGSALVVNDMNPSNGGTSWVLSQCVSATPNTEYSFGGRLMVPAGQPADTEATVVVDTYASGDCSGNILETEFESSSSVEQWELETGSFATGSGVHSLFFALAIYKPNGETADAAAHFDNVFLQQSSGPAVFTINPSMSASWYNPSESGHGIMIHLLDATQAWMCWFTFDLDGNPAWICALGNINGGTIVFANAFTVEGGNFPPLFNPSEIAEIPWGSINVTFTACDAGTMDWTTTAESFQSGSMPLTRLTSLWGNDCL